MCCVHRRVLNWALGKLLRKGTKTPTLKTPNTTANSSISHSRECPTSYRCFAQFESLCGLFESLYSCCLVTVKQFLFYYFTNYCGCLVLQLELICICASFVSFCCHFACFCGCVVPLIAPFLHLFCI